MSVTEFSRRTLISSTAATALAVVGCTPETGDPRSTPATASSAPGSSAASASPTASGPSAAATPTPSASPSPSPTPTEVAMAELPGGGTVPFPGRRMVALYGHPTAPVLGMLGEQGPQESVERLQKLVEEYRAAAPGENWIGAFEIITTIASSSAGKDGNYSILSSNERLLPHIEAAEANDIYVVLDLQPGRSTFLEQAKRYEELLKRPTVGLALDPEWRLKPGQKHMVQIGQVTIEEVNEVGAWLAQLVRDHNLPPKVLTLHQFQPRMIIDRERLDTSHPEIQYLVHVDGLGSQPAKQGTWLRILEGLPEGVFLGWKNFEHEDIPMLTPAQTVEQVSPLPHFISYQ